jgi:tetratricopeptide (TPR) repeat protein
MAKTEDPFVTKAVEFEKLLESPKGFRQKSIKFAFRLLALSLYPFSAIYPLSMGADYGRIWHIQKKEGFRKAVEFGCERLKKYLVKLNRPKPFFKSLNELNRQSAWMFFTRVLIYSCWDPRPEDEKIFNAVAEGLGIDSIGNDTSEAYCAMARMTWKLGRREEPWQWTERAIRADNENSDAFYLKGWLEIQLDRGNPVDSLFEAVTKDPDILRKMRNDEAIIRFPDFIAAVEARAKQAGLFVI